MALAAGDRGGAAGPGAGRPPGRDARAVELGADRRGEDDLAAGGVRDVGRRRRSCPAAKSATVVSVATPVGVVNVAGRRAAPAPSAVLPAPSVEETRKW